MLVVAKFSEKLIPALNSASKHALVLVHEISAELLRRLLILHPKICVTECRMELFEEDLDSMEKQDVDGSSEIKKGVILLSRVTGDVEKRWPGSTTSTT